MLLFIQQNLQGGAGPTYSLSGAAGTYVLAGQAAAFKVSHTLSGAAGTYALSGNAGSFKVGHTQTGTGGVYSLSGGAGTFAYTPGTNAQHYALVGAPGAYVLAGKDATFAWSGQQTGGGGYDEKKKKYVVRKGQKLLVFTDKAQAIAALGTKKPKVQEVVDVPETVKEVPLQAAKTMAAVQGRIEQYNSAYNSRHWEQVLRLFQEMQDEDDVEALLMSL